MTGGWIVWVGVGALVGVGAMSGCGSEEPSSGPPPGSDGGAGGPDVGSGGAACLADTKSDPKNCGVCGHDCLGAGCVDSLCAAVDIAGGIQGTEKIECFTIDDTSIYYALTTNTAEKQIRKMPLGGGNPTTLVTGELGCPMLQNGDLVYWLVDEKNLRSVPKAGGTPPVTAASWTTEGIMHARRIVTDGSTVYWVSNNTSGVVPFGGDTVNVVNSIPLTGGVVTPLASGKSTGAFTFSVVAVTADTVYFVDSTNVKKVAKTGGTPVLLAAGGGAVAPAAMAVDNAFVYWVRDEYFSKVTLAGGEPIHLARGAGATHLMIDSANGFYCDSNGLEKAPLTGLDGAQQSTLLAKKPTSFDMCKAGLELDATYVYWSTGDAIVHRLVK